MKRIVNIKTMVAMICLVVFSIMFGSEALADQNLRYSCSSQIFSAFEKERLAAFTARTGIEVDLHVGSSHACTYRLMADFADVVGITRELYRRHKDYGFVQVPFAKDYLAIIIHKGCAIENITEEQLQDIFSGNVANWQEVGGPDLPVTIVVPGDNTGAHKNFRRQVMKQKEIKYDYMTYSSTRVFEAIETLPCGAVSFISAGAAGATGTVKFLKIDGKLPSDKGYPYYQVFYFVTKGEPSGSINAFIDFAKGEKGKSIIRKHGMTPVD